MEIYLSHMFVYRLLERLGMHHLTGNEIVNYLTTVMITLVGAALCSSVLKNTLKKMIRCLQKNRG